MRKHQRVAYSPKAAGSRSALIITPHLALTPGTRLGPYEVLTQIGAGGMGEVYRATDTNLKRSVAIKVLPASVAGDAERLARFQREAEVLAALNHPNIAAIYGLERSGDTTALVMELVEGPTLTDRIAQGAIPIDEAVPIAKQIAEALEAAHEQGIIHRDLKPANIKVRSDGTVKVLDFGLAKAMAPAPGSSPNLSQSPTITTPAMTQAGMILGTAAYMSPEQAKGREADKRSDLWAFGTVLYEMLTGRRAFEGEDTVDVLSRVLQREPEWGALPAGVSPTLVLYLKRCLYKDSKQRLGDMHDMRLALEGAFDTTAPQTTSSATSSAPRGRLAWMAFGVALVAAIALGVPAMRHLRETPLARDSRRHQSRPPPTIPCPLPSHPTAGRSSSWPPATACPVCGCGLWPQVARSRWPEPRARTSPVLVARQPVDRLLRRWQAEAGRHRRRIAASIGNGRCSRRDLERGRRHSVHLLHNRSAVPRAGLGRPGCGRDNSTGRRAIVSLLPARWPPIPVLRARSAGDRGDLPGLARLARNAAVDVGRYGWRLPVIRVAAVGACGNARGPASGPGHGRRSPAIR